MGVYSVEHQYKMSICMMVKDEEDNLKRCLDKLKPIVDVGLAELIIIDTGSEDSTVSIAMEYTSNIYFHKWNKNFSDMRNISISYAKGEWIFIIDADERLDEPGKLESILRLKDLNKYNTILLQVKNLYNSTDESKYNLNVSPRIFRNDGKFRYEGSVHNQPIYTGPNLIVDISLTHFGYISNDKKLMEKKYQRTTELLKAELEENPNNLYYIYQLGVSYDMHSDFKEALEEFRKAYRLICRKNSKEKLSYNFILASHARAAYTNQELNEAIKIGTEAIKLSPDYVDMYYILALSSKRLGNKRDTLKYFLKYIDLANKYNNLDISKDMSIIMYHIDEASISNAKFEICQHYIGERNYNAAYEAYKGITYTNHKIYLGINILIELKKYEELFKIFYDLADTNEKNTFLSTLEDNVGKLGSEEKTEVYLEFSQYEGTYGLLNRLRLSDNEAEKTALANELISKLDLDKEPLFYSEVYLNMNANVGEIINSLTKFEVISIKNIIKFIVEKDLEFIKIFEDYLLNVSSDSGNLSKLKVSLSIANVLMLIRIKDGGIVSDKYSRIFDMYVEQGISYISGIYQIEKIPSIYKNISSLEDRFFAIMSMAIECKIEGNQKALVKYITEAVNLYEAMAKYIDIYKDNLFRTKENDAKEEFENYKIQVKENIKALINGGNFVDARDLINQYTEVVKQDIEIYSMKAIIAIMEGNMLLADRILNEGLELDPRNRDLLYNLSYIANKKNNNEQAIEMYSRAKLFYESNDIRLQDIIPDGALKSDKLRIINGTIEIANQMNTISTGLNRLGIDSKTLSYYPNYLGYKTDYILDINSFKENEVADYETKKLAAKLISENNLFHFHFGTSLTLDHSDLPLINELGKKCIMQHWGSDVRMYSKAIQFNPYVKVKEPNEDKIKRKLELISSYIPHCIVCDYELYEYVKEFYSNIYHITHAIDIEKYKPSNSKNKKFLIVHAPSAPEIKGTKYILEAIEALKGKYNFEFKLVQGMSHDAAKEIYQKADLIIDQILIGSHGLFAVEAMAMGKPVVCWISDFMKSKYPKDLPIISANPDNIREVIENVLKNRDMLSKIGNDGRKYVEKYHDMNIISKQLLDMYRTI
jgi:glycosyltransferase involved in cell wall biosynthesis